LRGCRLYEDEKPPIPTFSPRGNGNKTPGTGDKNCGEAKKVQTVTIAPSIAKSRNSSDSDDERPKRTFGFHLYARQKDLPYMRFDSSLEGE
jgi:hypothetical protein